MLFQLGACATSAVVAAGKNYSSRVLGIKGSMALALDSYTDRSVREGGERESVGRSAGAASSTGAGAGRGRQATLPSWMAQKADEESSRRGLGEDGGGFGNAKRRRA